MVRSIFFGDSLAFSVPFREQPGQPHHGRAQPGPLGGYRLVLEWVFFRLILFLLRPLCFCIFYRGDVHQCGILLYLCAASATARSHKWSALEEEQGSHTNLASSSLQFVFFVPVAGWREQGSGPTPVQHQGRRRSVRWTECVTFPLGQGCACQTSFLT